MNYKQIFKSRYLFFILSRNTSNAKVFIPPVLEPGVYPFPKRQIPLDGLKTFTERLEEIKKAKSGIKLDPLNIGYELPCKSKPAKNVKSDDLEILARKRKIIINSNEIDDLSQNTRHFILQKFNILNFFNIYDDLFHSTHYFYPIKRIELGFNLTNDEILPVYNGNLISPLNALLEPTINFESDDSSMWTLVMSCPDEHLEVNDKEYIHWMLSNISLKENNVVNKDCIIPYLQPIPYLGTGFHRYVFVLYKQDNGPIDLSAHRLSENCFLEERTFSSYEFLKQNQDNLTPVGASFFQASWDSSVRECFRNTLNCREPIFEYDWPKDKLKPTKEFPENEEMHTYLDQYRDVKEIREEVLKERLKTVDPFIVKPKLKFPLGVPDDPNEIGFVKERLKDKELRRNQWKDMDIIDEL